MKSININRRSSSLLRLLTFCAFASLSACASSPEPNLYLMKSQQASPIVQGSSNVSVVVGPVNMPEHLKRSEVVYRTNGHAIQVNENDRWAESLERNMASVISSNVAAYLGTDQSFDYYANFSTKPDYSVRLNVTEFGRVGDNSVSLSVSWELVNKSARTSKLYLENINVPINHSGDDAKGGANISNVVAAMNEALNELSLLIANKITG